MATVKTAISLDQRLLIEADAAARDLRTTRSGLITRALKELLRRREDDAISAKVNAIFSEPPDEDERLHLDAMALLQREVLGDEDEW